MSGFKKKKKARIGQSCDKINNNTIDMNKTFVTQDEGEIQDHLVWYKKDSLM